MFASLFASPGGKFLLVKSASALFLQFCELQGWIKWKVATLEQGDIISFLDYCQSIRKVSNTTRNSYLGYVRALPTTMKARGMITVNPALGVNQEREDEGRNIAFKDKQIASLKELICKETPRLWLFIQFMFYEFVRPMEIGKIRIYMIELENEQIVLPATITKNRKTRHVRISEPFKAAILELQLDPDWPNDFVFAHNFQTGTRPIQANLASTTNRKYVRELKFGSDYTLYSWKHTGVVKHYKAGVDLKSIQQQVGHSSLDETNRYLKSLGLLADKAAFDNSPQIWRSRQL